MVVDIIDILAAQLAAIVVDFVLDIERTVYIVVRLMTNESCYHLRQRLIGELHHLVHMLILLLSEVFFALDTAIDGACYVVAAVADTLELRNLAQHSANLSLCIVAKVSIADIIEIFSNLYLHRVGDALILLYASEELHKLILLGFAQ